MPVARFCATLSRRAFCNIAIGSVSPEFATTLNAPAARKTVQIWTVLLGLAYSREVATVPPGPYGTPMTVIPFEAAAS